MQGLTRCVWIDPLEVVCWKPLRHGPAIQVVGIVVLDLCLWFVWIEVLHLRVVGLGEELAVPTVATTETLLNEEVHVDVGEQLELHPCVL